MSQKIAVHFRHIKRARYRFERLRHCRHCGSYSTLWEERCITCNREKTFISVSEQAKRINQRVLRSDILIIALLGCAGVCVSQTVTELILAFGLSLTLFFVYRWFSKRFQDKVEQFRLHQILTRRSPWIQESLEIEIENSVNDMLEERFKDGYEKLREISLLIDNNDIRKFKLACLNHFILRRDMELELATLIPNEFDPDYAIYLLDVGKINPQLINVEVINFALREKERIQDMEQGQELLVQIASAVLLVKGYLKRYHAFIEEYVSLLQRDALLRLCKLLSEDLEAYPSLVLKAKEVVKLKHQFDPEFQGVI